MAVELYSDNPSSMGVMSPRISFSYDLCQSDVASMEQKTQPLRSNSSSSRSMNSSMEFDFCVRESFEQESSSADELFSDGKMIPTEIKKKSSHQPKQLDQIMPPLPTAPATNQRDPKITMAKESKNTTSSSSEGDEKQNSKSFWSFKRSSSCGSGYGRTLCPLPLLSRSNSTGSSSSSSAKRSLFSKEGQNQKQNSHKSASKKPSSSSSQYSSALMSNYQKPPLKKGQYGSYGGNAAPFSPVLNVPAANMLGFGSIFSNGKDKTKKK
ncbi:hypothetical protein ACFX13_026091 [Malus domestica]|uniref:Uncharacterized protein n=1 Tax=Malus domestica TaxID=3750 RepID=A0A498HIB5_MALDO|nr:putative protein TPRXL [Malus domestica]XP_050134967.1 uncharacterized protein LOC126610861 [Malus sylvestris]RXH68663.1 hypothetical protein DVH24_030996 [Malus domestica]